jgi:hypothetical protein
MPQVQVIEVSDWLIQHTEELRIQVGGVKIPCRSGKQLGSLHGDAKNLGQTLDYLPRYLLGTVTNVDDFARVLVLDKWTCNSDGRQAIFRRKTQRVRGSRRHSSIRDIVSTLETGVFPTRH